MPGAKISREEEIEEIFVTFNYCEKNITFRKKERCNNQSKSCPQTSMNN